MLPCDEVHEKCPVTGKACFDRVSANIMANIYRRRSKRERVPCRSYMCEHCGAWHLTHFENKRNDFMRKQNVARKAKRSQYNTATEARRKNKAKMKELVSEVNRR